MMSDDVFCLHTRLILINLQKDKVVECTHPLKDTLSLLLSLLNSIL